ncbi:thioredoxin-like protein [Clavulina sp. PMI_390]|nr:thioredoxin-like protein [Clavulina sp. PMI_390]
MDNLSLTTKTAAAAPIKIVRLTVTQDTICPWCFLGWKELEAAVIQAHKSQLPLKFDIELKPYRLDSTLPVRNPLDKKQLYTGRFGSDRFSQIQSVLNERGERFGVSFSFEGPIRRSGHCHRLLRYAFDHQRELYVGECVPLTTCIKNDLQSKLTNVLFEAHFINGEDIADFDVLARCAEQVGLMSYDDTLDFLNSSAYKEEVEEMMEEAQDAGISGVPFTVINSRWAVAGSQSAEQWYSVFEKIAASE